MTGVRVAAPITQERVWWGEDRGPCGCSWTSEGRTAAKGGRLRVVGGLELGNCRGRGRGTLHTHTHTCTSAWAALRRVSSASRCCVRPSTCMRSSCGGRGGGRCCIRPSTCIWVAHPIRAITVYGQGQVKGQGTAHILASSTANTCLQCVRVCVLNQRIVHLLLHLHR